MKPKIKIPSSILTSRSIGIFDKFGSNLGGQLGSTLGKQLGRTWGRKMANKYLPEVSIKLLSALFPGLPIDKLLPGLLPFFNGLPKKKKKSKTKKNKNTKGPSVRAKKKAGKTPR